MRLESALKHFSPKSLMISDSPRATASESLTGTDVMAALGMAQSRAELGFALFFAKHQKDKESREKAIKLLSQAAMKIAPKTIGKVAGRRMARALEILCGQAIDVYCRTADDVGIRCTQCRGRGLVAPLMLPAGAGVICDHSLAEEDDNQISGPDKRACPRCHGRGIKPVPSSRAYRAISALLPELPERTWSLNWKPFYESLITACEQEESWADIQFSKVTKTDTLAA